jgi:uncharacterized membrane protein
LAAWVAVGVAFGALLFTIAMLRRHAQLGGYDQGYFQQAAWLIAHGKPPFVTVRGLYLLGDHASPIFYVMALPARFVASGPFLLGVQSFALGLGVAPLAAFSRRVAGLGRALTAAIVAAYVFFPALHNVNVADMHPEAVAVPALLTAVLAYRLRRPAWFWPMFVVALACKEDFTIVGIFFGLWMILEGARRWGAGVLALSVVWFEVDTRMVMPHFAGAFIQTSFLSRYGTTSGAIVAHLVEHPVGVLGDLGTSANGLFALDLLVPLLFLPLLAPRLLAPVLPLELLYLLSDRAAAHTIYYQYTAAVQPFVFLAAAMALARLRDAGSARSGGGWGAHRGDRRADGVRLVRRVLGGTLAGALVAVSVGAWVQLADDRPALKPWAWGRSDATVLARTAAVRLVPPDAAVAASPRMWQLLSSRTGLYNYPNPWAAYPQRKDPVPLATRQQAVTYIVVDASDLPGDLSEDLAVRAPALGFRKIFDEKGIEVLRR